MFSTKDPNDGIFALIPAPAVGDRIITFGDATSATTNNHLWEFTGAGFPNDWLDTGEISGGTLAVAVATTRSAAVHG